MTGSYNELAKSIAGYSKAMNEEIAPHVMCIAQTMQTMEKERDAVVKAMVERLLRPTQMYLQASAAKIEEKRVVYEKDKVNYIKQVNNMTKKAEKAGRKVEKMQEAMKELIQTKKAFDGMVDNLRDEILQITHTHDIAMMEGLSEIVEAQLQYHGQCYALLTNIQQSFRGLPMLAKRTYDPNQQMIEEETAAIAQEDYQKEYTYDQYNYDNAAPPPPPPGAPADADYDYDEFAAPPPPPPPQ
jgi:hypothetical protein